MQPAGDHRSTGVDADQREALWPRVLLCYFVGDPLQRSPQVTAFEHNLLVARIIRAHPHAPSWPRWTGLKEPTRRGYHGARRRPRGAAPENAAFSERRAST